MGLSEERLPENASSGTKLGRRDAILAGLLLIVGCLQGYLFLTGYRLTADDVDFQYHWMSGWAAARDFTWLAAVSQGRVVHLLDVPFAMLAAYFADSLVFRLIYTVLYFGCFALLAVYISMVARARVAALVLLVLLSLHPLDYFHLPPNAYPVHLTLPFLLILLARIGLWRARARRGKAAGAWETCMLACCFVGMLFSEYGFLFAAALIGAEYFARLVDRHAVGGGWGHAVRGSALHPHTLKDAAVLALWLAIYIGFRLVYPSSYEGNQVAAELDLAAVGRTLVGHIFGGTSLASLARYHEQIPGVVRAAGFVGLLVAISIAAVTFAAAALALRQARTGCEETCLVRRCCAIGVASLMGAVLVTLPLALTFKYQAWCGDLSACVFLDSRISYLGVGAVLAVLLITMVVRFGKPRGIYRTGVSLALSALLAALGGLTYLNNLRVEWDMERYVEGWQRAARLSCLAPERLDEVRPLLPRLIDPAQRISMSPGFDREAYWLKYIEMKRSQGQACAEPLQRAGDVYPQRPQGRLAFNQGSSGARFLARGWYAPESWGAWSQGSEAEIDLPVRNRVESLVIEAHALLLPSHTEQPVVFIVNGVEVGRAVLDKPHDNRIELSIPEAVSQKALDLGVMMLKLRFLDPVNQRALGVGEDGRTLALGLRFITVREQSNLDGARPESL